MKSGVGVLVCVNRRLGVSRPCCAGRGSEAIVESLRHAIAARALRVEVIPIHCFGECERGPNVRTSPGGRFFHQVTNTDIETIIAEIERQLRDAADGSL